MSRFKLFYVWRLLGTGLAFIEIFTGGLLASTLLLPLLQWFPGDKKRRAQLIILKMFHFYLLSLEFFGLIDIIIHGKEKLTNSVGAMIVANHPTLLDTVVLMALVPKAQCIVKHELFTHPFLGGMIRHAGYIRNDLEAEALVEACRVALQKGANLIIFPEGTRTKPGTLPHFKRGFAHLALMTQARITPVVIDCTPPTLGKGVKWWRIPEEKPVLTLWVNEDIDTSANYLYPSRGLNARRLVKDLELYYENKLS